MIHFRHAGPVIGLAALLAGTTALADVTAQQVWEDWQANFDIYGEDAISVGAQEMANGTLTISDFRISFASDDSAVNATVETITFAEQGDGTVSVTMSDEILMTLTSEEEETQRVTLANRHSGLEIIVSGDPGAMDYAIMADRYALELVEVTLDGVAQPGDLSVALNNVNGNYISRTDDALRNVDYAINADSLDLLINIVDPDEGTQVDLSGTIADIVSRASMSVPQDVSRDDAATMVMNGFALNGGYTMGAASYAFSAAQDGQTTEGTATTTSSSVDVALDGDGMRYDTTTQGIAITAGGTTLPLPIDIGIGQYGVALALPLARSEEPADFALAFNLTELTFNNMIWSMIDAAGNLPRDPITLVADLSGTVRLLHDILDPEQAAAIEDAGAPGEIHTLSLNELVISGVGASVTGTGDFTFDNTDLDTFDGLPRPEGSATFVIRGANALLDTLVEMGLVPSDQVMGARMMLGLFATPTGEDELTSVIEVNEQGHLLANGQRLQ